MAAVGGEGNGYGQADATLFDQRADRAGAQEPVGRHPLMRFFSSPVRR